MRRVIVESPFASDSEELLVRNKQYAKRCVMDCFRRGESPLAFHLLHPQDGLLDDQTPSERALGIQAGMEWTKVADIVAVYNDLGISPGMEIGISMAKAAGVKIEYRQLD